MRAKTWCAFFVLLMYLEVAWAQGQARSSTTGFQAHGMPDPWVPDCSLAVGRLHLVAAVNQRVRFFDKRGSMTFDQGLVGPGQFLDQPSLLPFGSGAGDPVCAYDPGTDRFYLVTLVRNPDMLALCVSDDGNPNGSWHKYALDMDPFGDVIDFPDVGFDGAEIHVFARFENQSSPATRGKYCFLFDKSQAIAGILPSFQGVLLSDEVGSYTYACVRALEPAPARYLVSTHALSGSVNRMRLVAIQGPLGSAAFVQTNLAIPAWRFRTDVPQGGSATRLLTQPGCYYKHAVLRHGSLWTTHNVRPDDLGTDHTVVRWYEVAMNGWPSSGLQPELAQSGEVDMGLDELGAHVSTLYPSLDVDRDRNVALTFHRVSANETVSLWQGARWASDAPGSLGLLQRLKGSATPHPITSWVDYSTTQADPTAPGVFWGHGEYRTNRACTWISRLALAP